MNLSFVCILCNIFIDINDFFFEVVRIRVLERLYVYIEFLIFLVDFLWIVLKEVEKYMLFELDMVLWCVWCRFGVGGVYCCSCGFVCLNSII